MSNFIPTAKSERKKERYSRLKEENLCVRCAKHEPEPGTLCCITCKRQRAAKDHQKRHARGDTRVSNMPYSSLWFTTSSGPLAVELERFFSTHFSTVFYAAKGGTDLMFTQEEFKRYCDMIKRRLQEKIDIMVRNRAFEEARPWTSSDVERSIDGLQDVFDILRACYASDSSSTAPPNYVEHVRNVKRIFRDALSCELSQSPPPADENSRTP